MPHKDPEARKEYAKKYREAHRDKNLYETRKEYYKEYAKEWRKANPEKVKAVNDRWRQENLDRHREKRKEYYKKNKKKINKGVAEKYNNDPVFRAKHAHYRAKPEVKERTRWKRILAKYGLTKEGWTEIYEDQNGCCYICGRTEKQIKRSKSKYLVVDHNHITGRIRGLLCGFCNRTVLTAIRENLEVAKRIVSYLSRETNYGTAPDTKSLTPQANSANVIII